APRGQRSISRLRYQLRSPRLSSALVPAIATVYVSLPRRRLLRRWFARLGSARTRPLHIQLENRLWRTANRRRPNAHALEYCEAGQDFRGKGRLFMQRMKQAAIRAYAW